MIPENIGQRIRQARKNKGITQEQLASLLFVSRQTVSSWENARTQPDYETLQKLAALLDVSVSDLFGEANQPVPATDLSPKTAFAPKAEPISESNPESDACPPVLPKVVQPEEIQKDSRRLKAWRCTVALCMLLCLFIVSGFLTRTPTPRPEQFMKTTLPSQGHAHVTLYTKDCFVNQPSGEIQPTWHYTLFLREDHGVGFQIETLRVVYFLEEGHTTIDYSAAEIAQRKQTSHLNGYALMAIPMGFTPSARSSSHPLGVGLLLEGHDDIGSRLSFTHYIELPQI